MRCPYCGGLNPDQVEYCIRCGRDISARPPIAASRPQPTYEPPPQRQRPTYPDPQQQPPQQRPVYPPAQPSQQQQWSVYSPSQTPPQQQQPVQPPPPQKQQRRRERAPQPAPATPQPARPAVVAPEVPVPANYPPRTMEQLRDLEKLALSYKKLDETSEVGRKRIIRIAYQACHPWQQIATLFKASKEYQSTSIDTLIIRGLLDQPGATALYDYNNGQLILDRNVRLGSQIQTRYQISTGSGIDVDSVRVVLAE